MSYRGLKCNKYRPHINNSTEDQTDGYTKPDDVDEKSYSTEKLKCVARLNVDGPCFFEVPDEHTIKFRELHVNDSN